MCVAVQNLRHFVVVDQVNSTPRLQRKREVLVLGSCRAAENRFSVLRAGPLRWKQEEPELKQALGRNWLWNGFGGKGA